MSKFTDKDMIHRLHWTYTMITNALNSGCTEEELSDPESIRYPGLKFGSVASMKSSLFKRIRSGKDPLPYPPPCQYSYPWYSVVEEKGPHMICGWTAEAQSHALWFDWNTSGVVIFQDRYTIEERIADDHYLIRNCTNHHYQFRLYMDPNYVHQRRIYDVDSDSAHTRTETGAWMMQNVSFPLEMAPPLLEKI